MARWWWFKH